MSDVITRLAALHAEIESRKAHEYAAPTYRDTPALEEMATLLAGMTSTDPETLENRLAVTAYLARAYEAMFRIAIANRFYAALLALHALLGARTPYEGETLACFREDLQAAVKCRNYYGADTCGLCRPVDLRLSCGGRVGGGLRRPHQTAPQA